MLISHGLLLGLISVENSPESVPVAPSEVGLATNVGQDAISSLPVKELLSQVFGQLYCDSRLGPSAFWVKNPEAGFCPRRLGTACYQTPQPRDQIYLLVNIYRQFYCINSIEEVLGCLPLCERGVNALRTLLVSDAVSIEITPASHA
jgi:hypothetical protein